jgi:pyridoxamine 5'-phosphate oxidase
MGFDHLRQEYEGRALDEAEMAADPVVQVRRWLDDAVAAGLPIANGMTLATASAHGQPSARIVLLKEIDDRGVVFYTSYDSSKGQELAANPRAAAVLWWAPLHRQIRVQGRVQRVSAAESDAYFATRPRASNLSAMASPQSQVVADRAALEARVAELAAEWQGRDLVRPASWGGYRLVPDSFELWQGRGDRLHDRLRYVRDGAGGAWRIERLAP